ncbi:hypothetical protein J7J39_00060 [bacterium]|nr:hypothetical protein [bacterium]
MKFVLIFLFVVLTVYLWFVFLTIYHLVRFGVGKEPKSASLYVFLGSMILLILTVIYFSQVNWKEILKFIGF